MEICSGIIFFKFSHKMTSHKGKTELKSSNEENSLKHSKKEHPDDSKCSGKSIKKHSKKHSKDSLSITFKKECCCCCSEPCFQEMKSAFIYVDDTDKKKPDCIPGIQLDNVSPSNDVNNTFATFSPNDYDIRTLGLDFQFRRQRFTLTTTANLPFPIQKLVTAGRPDSIDVSIASLSNIFPIDKSTTKSIELIFTYKPEVLFESGSFSIYGATGVPGTPYIGSISVTYHSDLF